MNLNTADQAALEDLPGIGPAHAKAIIAARPFKSVDDLERVKGLGKARIDALKEPGHSERRRAAGCQRPPRPPHQPHGQDGFAHDQGHAEAQARARRSTSTPPRRKSSTPLPGIGPVKAQAIIEARPFKTIEDVMKVKGIKEGEFAKIKDMITVK